MVTIVDYGMGNIGSVYNMFRKIGSKCIITSQIPDIENAEKIVLPGVGAYDSGMEQLENLGLKDVIRKKALEDQIPMLGICLGAQLMLAESEEGNKKGLGLLEGKVIRFDFSRLPKSPAIPHMGWNMVSNMKSGRLNADLPEQPRFYFVHSYHFQMQHNEDVLMETTYGYSFCAAFERGKISGVQFHPEKSHKFGMALLKNFADKF